MPGVTLGLWQPGTWKRFLTTELGRLVADPPCGEHRTIRVDDRSVELYALPEPPAPEPPSDADASPPSPSALEVDCGRPRDRFWAAVELGGVVVSINVPVCLGCIARGRGPDPYDSQAGIEAVVRGLEQRAT